MPSLDNPRRKIARANVHLDVLHDEVRDWLSSQEHRIAEHSNTKPGEQSRSRELVNPPDTPPHLGLIVGDITHNLRSSLDHLAYQLARLNTAAAGRAQRHSRPFPSKSTAFPIYADLTTADQKKTFKNAIRSLTPPHRKLVLDKQPCSRTNDPIDDPLWILQELRNADTHRVIHTTVARIPPLDLATVDEGAPFDPEPDRPRHIHLQLGGWAKSTFEYTAKDGDGIYVAFDEPGTVFADQNVLSLLTAVRDDVVAVTESFEPEFR